MARVTSPLFSFDARGQIHRVAEDGVIEAQIRSHIAHDASARVDADADA